jgi:hypothetical protein
VTGIIARCTNKIQRNIITERVLDLSKEPRFDTGPFRKVRKELADLMAPAGAGGLILHDTVRPAPYRDMVLSGIQGHLFTRR